MYKEPALKDVLTSFKTHLGSVVEYALNNFRDEGVKAFSLPQKSILNDIQNSNYHKFDNFLAKKGIKDPYTDCAVSRVKLLANDNSTKVS